MKLSTKRSNLLKFLDAKWVNQSDEYKKSLMLLDEAFANN